MRHDVIMIHGMVLIDAYIQVSLISDIDTMIFRPTEWTSDVQDGFGLDIANVSHAVETSS